jgi:hypothetical protein
MNSAIQILVVETDVAARSEIRTPRRKMRQTSEDNYVSECGFRMQREYGLTPNGNSIAGRWVLRGPDAEWLDVDQYRHDLMERHGFVTG